METTPLRETGGLRAVVCEREWVISQLFVRALIDAGFQVVGQARSCESSIALTVIERPDLLVMEACLTEAVSALDAARVILATRPVCILLVADRKDDDFEREALNAGIARVIVKPVDVQTLSNYAAEVYNEHCARIPQKLKVANEGSA